MTLKNIPPCYVCLSLNQSYPPSQRMFFTSEFPVFISFLCLPDELFAPPRWGTDTALSHVIKIVVGAHLSAKIFTGRVGEYGKDDGSLLRCVGWVCLAFLAALLTDVCIAQPGKTLGYTEKFVSEISGEQRVPFFLFLRQGSNGVGSEEFRLLALTIATDETDGYKRFMRSAKANNIDVKVFVNYSCSYIKRVISCTAVCFRRKFLATWW